MSMLYKNKKQSRASGFSSQSISKAVKRAAIENPVVLYPAAGGVLGLTALLLLPFSWASLSLTLAGFIWSISSFVVNTTLRKEQYAREYLQQIFNAMHKKREIYANQLFDGLKEVKSEEGIDQFNRLNEKYTTFVELLSKKLNPKELTYSQFIGTAEMVYLSALDNLNDLVNTLKGLKTIDQEHISERLQELRGAKGQVDSVVREETALRTRQKIADEQTHKLQEFLTQNEEAMTQIDIAISNITAMRTEDTRSQVTIQDAMQRLSEIASRTEKYNRKST